MVYRTQNMESHVGLGVEQRPAKQAKVKGLEVLPRKRGTQLAQLHHAITADRTIEVTKARDKNTVSADLLVHQLVHLRVHEFAHIIKRVDLLSNVRETRLINMCPAFFGLLLAFCNT